MCSAVACARIPYINVFGCPVEVTAKYQSFFGIARLRKPVSETIEPCELGLIKQRADDSSIRSIKADDADITAESRHHSRFGKRLVIADVRSLRRSQRLAEIRHDLCDPEPAGDRNAVPTSFSMMRQLVTRFVEDFRRRITVGELGLL